MNILFLLFGSAVGGAARWGLSSAAHSFWKTDWPAGTFAVNMSGCFLVGFLDVLARERFVIGPEARLFLIAGFCGAYTTFSAFLLETAHLLRNGAWTKAALTVGGSCAIGLALVWLGAAAARSL